jgi:flagellar assembly protein FliH
MPDSLMASATRFQFDTVFDAPAPEPEPCDEETPPPPSFTEEELAREAARAFARGREEALAEAGMADSRQTAAAIEAIGAALSTLGPICEAGLKRCRADALMLAAAIVRKVVPKAMHDATGGTVEALLVSVLPQLMDEPRLVIRVSGALLETLRQHIEDAARGCGYPGKIIMLADETLDGPDCRIEWADGGAEFETGRIWREIDAAVDRHLNGVREHEAAPAAGDEMREESTDV